MRAKIHLQLKPTSGGGQDRPYDIMDRFEKSLDKMTATLHSVHVSPKGDMAVDLIVPVPQGRTIAQTANGLMVRLADDGWMTVDSNAFAYAEIVG